MKDINIKDFVQYYSGFLRRDLNIYEIYTNNSRKSEKFKDLLKKDFPIMMIKGEDPDLSKSSELSKIIYCSNFNKFLKIDTKSNPILLDLRTIENSYRQKNHPPSWTPAIMIGINLPDQIKPIYYWIPRDAIQI